MQYKLEKSLLYDIVTTTMYIHVAHHAGHIIIVVIIFM